MNTVARIPGCSRLALAAARCVPVVAVLLSALASDAAAQPYRYGLQRGGKVILDTTLLDKLPAGGGTNYWADLEVVGPDRWQLRRDGTIWLNGEQDDKLLATFAWVDIEIGDVEGQTVVYALRQDGVLAVNGILPPAGGANLPTADENGINFAFTDLAVDGGTTWALRVDGQLFQGSSMVPLYDFGDLGTEQPFSWLDVEVDPTDGIPYVLRSDGNVFRGEGKELEGVLDATLPAPGLPLTSSSLTSVLYHQIVFDDAGDWYVLRGNGQVFKETSPLLAILDFGDDTVATNKVNEWFFGFDELDGEVWAIRWDGKVYGPDDPAEEFFDYTKTGYTCIVLTDVGPDVTNIKNNTPAASKYKAVGIEGTPVVVPIVVTDVDKQSDELIVSVVGELPEGVTFDAEKRTLTADGQIVGGAKIKIAVDDGVASKPKNFKYSVKIKPVDTNPDKNKKPAVAKIKGSQALVGFPFPLTILAADPDGDDVTIAPVLDKGVFALPDSDASFDAKTSTMWWTPTFADIGNQQARFTVSDGTVTKKVKVKIVVVNALITPPEPEEEL